MDTLIWSITNLISNLLLPPTALLVLIAVGIWCGKTRRWGRWLASVSLLMLILLSIPMVGISLKQPFENAYPPFDVSTIKDRPKDSLMVVVLGGGRHLGALEYVEKETLNSSSLRRCRYAASIAATLKIPLGVTGGKPSGGSFSEAELMRRFIEQELSYPVTIVEDQSVDTRQNARFMGQRLKERKIATAILVTDVMHMPRSVRAFEAAGVNLIAAPTYYHSNAPRNIRDFLPSGEGMEMSYQVFRELLGEVWYRGRGMVEALTI
jgi:uncharacterized SAM-binding protein YcdF (DUF218 family)